MSAGRGSVRRWLSRAAALLVATPAAVLAPATPALADDDKFNLGQTPPVLAWIHLKDSHGISMWNSELSIDRGGLPFSAGKFFWSSVTDMEWGVYRAIVAVALWFIDWVMSFTWIHVIASPLIATGDALQSVLNRIGAVPTLLTITAFVAVLLMARGRYATGIWELAISLVIAALATGVFAQPVRLVAGDNGLIMKTNAAALQLSGELAAGGTKGKTTEELRKQQTGQLVDTFIRQPTQMINFGRVIDGGKCESVYNKVIKAGPYGEDSDIRDAIGRCSSGMGDYAKNPSSSMATSSIVFAPAGWVVLVLAIMLAGAVVVAGCNAMFQSLKAIVALVFGLLPGGGRGSLFITIAEVAMSLLTIVFTTLFLGVFLQLIQAMFSANNGMPMAQKFVIVDVVLIVGLVIFWRQRKRIKNAAPRLAEAMAKRPGGSPTPLPSKVAGGNFSPSSAVRTAASIAQLAAARKIASPHPAPHPAIGPPGRTVPPVAAPTSTPPAPWPPVPKHGDPAGGPTQPGLNHPRRKQLMPADDTGLKRVTARKSTGAMKTLGRVGAGIALSAATGGTSTVATVAAKAVITRKAITTGRRATLATKLATHGKPGPSAAGGNPELPRTPSASRKPTSTHSTGQTITARSTQNSSPPKPRSQYNKVVRDGVVLLVPKETPTGPPAIRRSRGK